MGESTRRIHVTGDPALDALRRLEFLSRDELASQLGIALRPPVVVLTHHPSTRDSGAAILELEGILRVLKEMPGTVIATAPNSDAGQSGSSSASRNFRPGTSCLHLRESLGQLRFYLRCAMRT